MPKPSTKKPAAAAPTAKVVHYYDDHAGMVLCRAPGFTFTRTQQWAKVTCPACLKGAPKAAQKPAHVQLTAEQLRIAVDALRMYAEHENDLSRSDCWGDSAGQRAKQAEYDYRIELADTLARSLAAKLAE